MITWAQGDLFASGLPAIGHGCNCRGVMGAGIATQFRLRWPAMYEAYRDLCVRGKFRPGGVMPWYHPGGVLFSLATQDEPGPFAQPWMIAAAVSRMICEAYYDHGIREIGLPMIGCGIGGLRRGDLAACLRPLEAAPASLIIFSYVPEEGS